ncbi:hypothetical protein I302_101445 [Kwoniella bestiolae CBS 10118]|uniref:AB hydrolase-1 domain-containing protein n=1 Tax=Kwoniella bestiolae CBS 10118 TaxID=1296100 RepID=A0A1B9GC81_9TREE|nr:hypothetical protein I302_00129 [Kwoniella bestiolae CBS 10118]OCF28640.1 hypothetical protein I302_00129 [Kwoniella bestiolae CBS 10118]
MSINRDPFPESPIQHVSINGARLAYRTKGDPSGPLMITLHGGRGFGTHESDFKAYNKLGDSVQLVSFDFRGHGQSSPTPPYTFDQIVQDIESVRQHFIEQGDGSEKKRKFILEGGSFGGMIAQQYAITFAENVDNLILRGTAPSWHHEEEALQNLISRAPSKAPMATSEMLSKVFGAFTDDNEMRLIFFAIAPLWVDSGYNPNEGLEVARRTVYNSESHNQLYSDREKYFDFRPNLKLVTAKTLIIVGQGDWTCPPSQSEEIHRGIPDSRLVVFEGAGHFVQHEKNREVLEVVRDFLGI